MAKLIHFHTLLVNNERFDIDVIIIKNILKRVKVNVYCFRGERNEKSSRRVLIGSLASAALMSLFW